MALTPEEQARKSIDTALHQAGWDVQDVRQVNVNAAQGVAIREFPLQAGYGTADYLLYVNGKAAGALEAKKEGTTLSGVEIQTEKYSEGVLPSLPAQVRPLPFLYQSTGVETFFTNRLDPEPRSRRLFHVHRPALLAAWLQAEPQAPGKPSTFRSRLQQMPPLQSAGLWSAQRTAVLNLEASLADDRPRALIQMATGSGKTFTAITAIYRLIKYAKVQRVLFLVDRRNLGKQALQEFQQYTTPDDGRKFTEQRDQGPALRFLKKAIRRHGVPAKITIDGSAANEAAIKSYNDEHGTAIAIRKIKYLNNIAAQDHRAVKRVTRPMLGFKSFDAAQGTLAGIELMHMIKKEQMVVEAGDEGLSAAEQSYALAA